MSYQLQYLTNDLFSDHPTCINQSTVSHRLHFPVRIISNLYRKELYCSIDHDESRNENDQGTSFIPSMKSPCSDTAVVTEALDTVRNTEPDLIMSSTVRIVHDAVDALKCCTSCGSGV